MLTQKCRLLNTLSSHITLCDTYIMLQIHIRISIFILLIASLFWYSINLQRIMAVSYGRRCQAQRFAVEVWPVVDCRTHQVVVQEIPRLGAYLASWTCCGVTSVVRPDNRLWCSWEEASFASASS